MLKEYPLTDLGWSGWASSSFRVSLKEDILRPSSLAENKKQLASVRIEPLIKKLHYQQLLHNFSQESCKFRDILFIFAFECALSYHLK